jgi:hypothetical protein
MTQLFEELGFAHPHLDFPDSHPVDAGRAPASVRGSSAPCVAKRADIGGPIPHVPPGFVGVGLAPLIEFALNAEYPDFICLVIRVHVITPP